MIFYGVKNGEEWGERSVLKADRCYPQGDRSEKSGTCHILPLERYLFPFEIKKWSESTWAPVPPNLSPSTFRIHWWFLSPSVITLGGRWRGVAMALPTRGQMDIMCLLAWRIESTQQNLCCVLAKMFPLNLSVEERIRQIQRNRTFYKSHDLGSSKGRSWMTTTIATKVRGLRHGSPLWCTNRYWALPLKNSVMEEI